MPETITVKLDERIISGHDPAVNEALRIAGNFCMICLDGDHVECRNPDAACVGCAVYGAPLYTTSHDALVPVLAEIERRGLEIDYIDNLDKLLCSGDYDDIEDVRWNAQTAPAHVIAVAALMTLKAS